MLPDPCLPFSFLQVLFTTMPTPRNQTQHDSENFSRKCSSADSFCLPRSTKLCSCRELTRTLRLTLRYLLQVKALRRYDRSRKTLSAAAPAKAKVSRSEDVANTSANLSFQQMPGRLDCHSE